MPRYNDSDKYHGRINGEEEGDTGEGGQEGSIAFSDFISGGDDGRDDQLSPGEEKRLLIVHKETHEDRVKKQKSLREERKALKEGKIPLATFRQGLGAGMQSQYKVNPILANKAQFSGIDKQIIAIPSENIAETNQENRAELENQYRLRYAPENAPRFNPKPQYR